MAQFFRGGRVLEFYPFAQQPQFFLSPAAIARICGSTVRPGSDDEYESEANPFEEEADSEIDRLEHAPRCSISKIGDEEWRHLLSAICAYVDNGDKAYVRPDERSDIDWVCSRPPKISLVFVVFLSCCSVVLLFYCTISFRACRRVTC
jgi:hypothetical protein